MRTRIQYVFFAYWVLAVRFLNEVEQIETINKILTKIKKMDLKEIAKEIHQNNVLKVFGEDKEIKNVGEVLMLCVSELSKALEAHRKGKINSKEKYEKELLHYNWSKESDGYKMKEHDIFVSHVKDTFEDEIADTVIRLLDLSEGFGIDLEWHIEKKLKYNKTRPYKHNKAY